jgi:hypothetical protein
MVTDEELLANQVHGAVDALSSLSVAGTRPNGMALDERRGHLFIVNSGSVNGAGQRSG